MICPSCGHDNPEEARFCGACGVALAAASGTPFLPQAAVAAPSAVYGGFWIRLAAWAIDLVIVYIATLALSLLLAFLTLAGSFTDFVGMILFLLRSLATLALPVLYFVLLTGLRGQTVGKMAMGIRVVNQEGLIPGVGSAALRETVGKLASGVALGLGFLWIAWDPRKQGWHDKMARTRVTMARR